MLLFVHFRLRTGIDTCCDIVRDQLFILCNIYVSKSNWPLALSHAFQCIYCRCILKLVNLLMNNDSIVFDVDWRRWSCHAFSKKWILFHCCNQHTMITTRNARMKSFRSLQLRSNYEVTRLWEHLYYQALIKQHISFNQFPYKPHLLFFILLVTEYFTAWYLDTKITVSGKKRKEGLFHALIVLNIYYFFVYYANAQSIQEDRI